MPLRSGPGSQAQWPPRSPQEVLASTPGGRERLRRMAERASPSPSPLKKSRTISALTNRSGNARGMGFNEDDDMDMDDEEEDEETLKLKLQAIEAKLKLKTLQRKQRRGAAGSSDAENTSRFGSGPTSVGFAVSRAQSRAAMLNEGPKLRPMSQAEVQVPASPVRRAQTVIEQRSPSRVLLGIDKGLRAQDVSLKRASSPRKPYEVANGQVGYLRRAHTPAPSKDSPSSSQDRPKTFSERLAAARTEEESRRDKQQRIKQIRSKAFNVGQQEVERYKNEAKDIPDVPSQPESFSREEVIAGGQLRRSNTVPSLRKDATQDPESVSTTPLSGTILTACKKKVVPSEVPEEEAASFEPFSSTHLSKRILPHNLLTRTFSEKKSYLIKDLLRDVKHPDFQLPEVEQDVIVLGIVASKSEPKSHKPMTNPREKKGRFDEEKQRGKYMVINLVDLQYQIELFLFDTAFDRYWKMTPGTLIAILNPIVMPPPKGQEHTGRFSLVLNSDGDTVLEIGTARDLGFCKSVKKDGELCNSWVNKKRTEFCEFHMNTALDRKRLARQEVNSGSGLGPRSNKPNREKYQRDWKKEQEDKKRGNYDRYTHSHFFVSQSSASSLLDNEQLLPGQVGERVERSDALRRRLAAEEKERDIMKQLSKTGRGAGRDYMRLGEQSKTLGSSVSSAVEGSLNADDSSSQKPQADAKSLGLLAPRGRGAEIHLSPIKRKRVNSSFNSVSSSALSAAAKGTKTSSAAGFGWGGPLKDKLSRMKEGEKLDGSVVTAGSPTGKEKSEQPARKKTRFVTEKGIRVAGRESLGAELWKDDKVLALDDLDDSDDELVILK